MTCRRCVNDDDIEAAASSSTADLQKGGQLVDAWQRQLQEAGDVFTIEPRSTQGDLFERRHPASKPASDRARRIELSGMQHRSADLQRARGGTKRMVQGIGK